MRANLPGTGDTVIKQAVPPGGDSALHLALLKPAIAQTGWLGCVIFGRGGLRSRIPRICPNNKINSEVSERSACIWASPILQGVYTIACLKNLVTM